MAAPDAWNASVMPQPSACSCEVLRSGNLLLDVDVIWACTAAGCLWTVSVLFCRDKKDSLVESLVQSSPFDVERRGESLPQDQILSRLVAALQRVNSGAPGELSMEMDALYIGPPGRAHLKAASAFYMTSSRLRVHNRS